MKPSLLVPLSFLAYAAPAFAADDSPTGLDAHGFNLAAYTDDPRGALQVQRPVRFEQWDAFVGGVLEYAHEPLVLVTVDGEGNELGRDAVLDNIVALNASAGVALFDWLRLDGAVPLYFTSTGTGEVSNGFDLGDARFDAMVELVRPSADTAGGFGFGVVPYVDVPIGNADHFLGQGGITGGGKLAATYEFEKVTLGADAGVQFQPEVTGLDNLVGSDRALVGAQIGYMFTPNFAANLEGKIAVPFSVNPEPGTDTPAELTLSIKDRLKSGVHFLAGASAAVSEGASAADFRLFLGGGFGTLKDYTPVVTDRDNDRIPDNVDKCPDQPETYNGRHDDDGCPEAPATLAVTVNYQGKPVTGADIELKGGAAPMNAKSTGAPWTVEADPARAYTANAKYGSCLGGTNTVTTAEEGRTDLPVDLKPVLDASATVQVVDKATGKVIPGAHVGWASETDGCVPHDPVNGDEKVAMGAGHHTATAAAPGYRPAHETVDVAPGEQVTRTIQLEPLQTVVKDNKIMILAPVYFDYNLATIKPESFQILDDVYQTMIDHPEIKKVEVQGHTDSDGSDTYNVDLSQRRVESVRKYLMDKGIDGDRLVAKGYGESKPIATNKTEAGKAKNRRVEFVILEQAAPPPPGQGAGKNR